jgi:myo-inositol 2-dehydrogenase/D-chiro-inositol 1-dehydrogenase
MFTPRHPANVRQTSRRQFLKRSATVAGAAIAVGLPLARGVHAAGSGTFKVGLIGCGGRGSGAAANAMNAGKDIKLVAMADVFEDKVKGARDRLKKIHPEQVAVDDERCFVGFDAYQKVLDSGIDVAIIACTSHFHPAYLKAAIEAGKHVFCEKPHSLDVPGLKLVQKVCEEAKRKGLAVVSGLCWRYDPGMRETIKRVQDGAIGKIMAVQETYCVGPYNAVERRPEWNEMQWQMRDWYHFNWLAGDQVMQQLIHSIDKGAWVLGDQPPLKAWGIGGRSACFGAKYGDLFDHQGVVFEYPGGVRMFGICRNHIGCYNEVTDTVFGTKGVAHLIKNRIEGQSKWEYKGPKAGMYDVEHQELFDSIRAGKPINNGNYMVGSTMLALLGQAVCQTGQEITWERAMQSTASVELPRYGWDVEPPIKPNAKGEYDIAVPGITKFA